MGNFLGKLWGALSSKTATHLYAVVLGILAGQHSKVGAVAQALLALFGLQ